MGIELVPNASAVPSMKDSGGNQATGSSHKRAGQGVRRPRYTQADLPFPPSTEAIRSGRTLWRTHFVPSLLDWAGSCDDPFGTNSRMEGAVTTIWKRVYPHIVLGDESMAVVLHVVCAPIILHWHRVRGTTERSDDHPSV
jgi:hypothetical protein